MRALSKFTMDELVLKGGYTNYTDIYPTLNEVSHNSTKTESVKVNVVDKHNGTC